jgi:hypothetical protein
MSEIKVSDPFKQVVQAELTKRAESDPLFAASFAKPNKSIDECISYILNTVKNSGIAGFTDDEIFGMAAHYYDEDNIGTISEMKCKVIVNHTVSLTEEEIQKAKQEAKDKVIADEMNRLKKKPETKKAETETTQTFMF